jgi:hypothetical protein
MALSAGPSDDMGPAPAQQHCLTLGPRISLLFESLGTPNYALMFAYAVVYMFFPDTAFTFVEDALA